MPRSEEKIKEFYIDSFEEYDKQLPRIKKICECEKARGYFRINKRNYNKIGFKLIRLVTYYMESGNVKSIRNVFNTVAGEEHSDPDKKWLVDIDWVDFEPEHEITQDMMTGTSKVAKLISRVIQLQIESGREPMSEMLPTKNGMHLICRPFRLDTFNKEYPFVQIHKDNLTIIFCP